MFVKPPEAFTKVREATQSLGKFTPVSPPDVESLGARMRKLYAGARETGYASLSRGAIRRLPYALWLPGEVPLGLLEPKLLQAYWDEHLPRAVKHPRSAKRWLMPLFFTYCHEFKRGDLDFDRFVSEIRGVLAQAEGSAALWMLDLQQQYRWFQPAEVGALLGRKLCIESRTTADVLAGMGLWSGFLGTKLASEAFHGVVSQAGELLSRSDVVGRVLSWSRTELPDSRVKTVFRYPEHRIALADGLVKPWIRQTPPDALRNELLSHLIKHYGDPRTIDTVNRGHHWQGVSPATLATVRRWMVGDTLRGFMRVLQLTADEIWRHREKFWMAYYDRGVVEEAWLALGSQAAWRAQRELGKAAWRQYGQLTAGAAPDQSVLLLRIGQVVFMEWSHNGSLRAVYVHDEQMPALYQSEYSGHELRQVQSLDFHDGMNQNPQLTHAHSDRGTWQRKARDFIDKHTGVRLNDRAILDA